MYIYLKIGVGVHLLGLRSETYIMIFCFVFYIPNFTGQAEKVLSII